LNGHFNRIVKELDNEYRVKNKIDEVIVGYNVNWKKYVNMGHENNRKFYQIPYRGKLLNKMWNKSELYGTSTVETNESYTSVCDALAYEKICIHEEYLGIRCTRGRFLSSTSDYINADQNWSINIMRKKYENHRITGKDVCSPKRIKIKRQPNSQSTRADLPMEDETESKLGLNGRGWPEGL